MQNILQDNESGYLKKFSIIKDRGLFYNKSMQHQDNHETLLKNKCSKTFFLTSG